MWLGIGISITHPQPRGNTPPPAQTYFLISENTGDILEMEANTDQMVSEAAP